MQGVGESFSDLVAGRDLLVLDTTQGVPSPSAGGSGSPVVSSDRVSVIDALSHPAMLSTYVIPMLRNLAEAGKVDFGTFLSTWESEGDAAPDSFWQFLGQRYMGQVPAHEGDQVDDASSSEDEDSEVEGQEGEYDKALRLLFNETKNTMLILRGVQLLRRLADDKQDRCAMSELGMIYLKGYGPIRPDRMRAILYLNKAAAAGDEDAIYTVSALLQNNDYGIRKNPRFGRDLAKALTQRLRAGVGGVSIDQLGVFERRLDLTRPEVLARLRFRSCQVGQILVARLAESPDVWRRVMEPPRLSSLSSPMLPPEERRVLGRRSNRPPGSLMPLGQPVKKSR